VVTIHPKDQSKFEKIMAGNVIREIGFVASDGLFQITGLNGKLIIKKKSANSKTRGKSRLIFRQD